MAILIARALLRLRITFFFFRGLRGGGLGSIILQCFGVFWGQPGLRNSRFLVMAMGPRALAPPWARVPKAQRGNDLPSKRWIPCIRAVVGEPFERIEVLSEMHGIYFFQCKTKMPDCLFHQKYETATHFILLHRLSLTHPKIFKT